MAHRAPDTASLDDLFGVDLRSLALLRIWLGSVLLVDLALRLQDFTAHYCRGGWLPLEAMAHVDLPRWDWAPHMLSDDPAWQGGLFALQFVLGFAFLVGYRTRLATFGCWFLNVSLQMRNPAVLDGADMLLRCMLFWCMFLPMGAFASVDARREPGLRGPPARIRSLATLALLLQPVYLYEFAALTKVQPEWLYEGTGVYYALHLDQLALPLGIWLREFTGLLWFFNYATLALEYVGPILLFCPWWHTRVRVATILSFVGLQVGFGTTIRLMLFPWVSTSGLIGFLPTRLWDALARRWHFLALPREGPTEPPTPLRTHPAASALAGTLSLYCFVFLLTTLPAPPFRLPAWARAPAFFLRLDQQWYLFAPPWKSDGWYVETGVLPMGAEIDLKTGRRASWDKPAGGTYEMFDTHRTWAHMRFLRTPDARPLRAYYLRDRAERRPEPIVAARLYYVMETTWEDGEIAEPERGLLWEERRTLGIREVTR